MVLEYARKLDLDARTRDAVRGTFSASLSIEIPMGRTLNSVHSVNRVRKRFRTGLGDAAYMVLIEFDYGFLLVH